MRTTPKIFASLLFLFVLAACGTGESSTGGYQEGQIDIGETVNVRTFPSNNVVEVTVNSMNLGTEAEGQPIEEFIVNPLPESRLLVVDMTINNTSDEAITPAGELPTTRQEDGRGNDGPKMIFFPEFEEPIEPGEEVNGTLVFTSTTSNSYDAVSMNINDSLDGHVYWEIPGLNAE